jgi:uncharacterized membrane protein
MLCETLNQSFDQTVIIIIIIIIIIMEHITSLHTGHQSSRIIKTQGRPTMSNPTSI